MYDLGLILRELRVSMKLTQLQVAKKLNVTESTICHWENNYKMPAIGRLIDIACLYKVSLNYLVGIDKEKAVVIGDLTTEQQNIINTMLLEFRQKTLPGKKGLTSRQQDIINMLINEFNDRL